MYRGSFQPYLEAESRQTPVFKQRFNLNQSFGLKKNLVALKKTQEIAGTSVNDPEKRTPESIIFHP
jgi:hypothetical protein